MIVNVSLPNTPAVPSLEIEKIISSLEVADAQFSAKLRLVYKQFEKLENNEFISINMHKLLLLLNPYLDLLFKVYYMHKMMCSKNNLAK